MWVVKLGGSLEGDAALPQWLALLAEMGGGRVVIVPGGGVFAEQAREAQVRWPLDDVAAHNLAVLGMAQMAELMHGLCPALHLASSEDALRRVLQSGQTALWRPLDLLRTAPDELTNWGVTSDSLALWLAQGLSVERVMIVKSCAVEPGSSWTELSATGVLDADFARRARDADARVELLHKSEFERARALLADHAPDGGP